MSDLNYFVAGRINTTPLDFNGNLEKILVLSEKAKENAHKLLVLPELCLSGYGCGDMFNHPELLKAATRALLTIKYSLPEDLTVGVGAPLLGNDGRVYDGYVMIKKGRILGVSVLHSLYNSKDARIRYFSTSFNYDLTFAIGSEIYSSQNLFEVDGHKVCVLFNDADNKLAIGCDLAICPEANRFELYDAVEREQKLVVLSKAIDAAVVSTNLLGCESGSDIFDGLSIIANKGVLVARSSFLSFKRCDLFNANSGVFNYLSEYDTIVRAVALGQFDWMLKTKAHGFALSMSGGADSGLCATCVAYGQLAALHELGYDEYKSLMEGLKFEVPPMDCDEETFIKTKMMKEVLITVYQGSAVSGSVTRTAAAKVSENIGARHHEWSIAKLVEEYVSLINSTTPGDDLSWEKDDLTLQNIQARSRAPGIWMIANRYNKLLMSTCNASEDAVGYCTMDGDTAGGLSPIGDISKSRVLKINQHIADDGIEVVSGGLKLNVPNMSYISAQAPTAELRPGGEQTDERDLMPYVILDRIHVLHQEFLRTPQAILDTLVDEYSSFSREELLGFVKKYFGKFAVNQWKRERGATTFHIERSDLNAKSGFIFPLLNDGYSALLSELK